MPIHAHALICLLILAVVGASPAAADAILDQIVSDALRHGELAMAVTRQSETTTDEGDDFSAVERYDPAKNPPWTLWFVNQERASARDKVRYAEDMAYRPAPDSYARVARYLDNGAKRIREDDTTMVYRIRKLGAGSIMADKIDLSAELEAEIIVALDEDGAWVREVTMTTPDDIKARALATVRDAKAHIIYKKLESGHKVVAWQSIRVQGSAQFRDYGFSTETTYMEYEMRDAGITAVTPTP